MKKEYENRDFVPNEELFNGPQVRAKLNNILSREEKAVRANIFIDMYDPVEIRVFMFDEDNGAFAPSGAVQAELNRLDPVAIWFLGITEWSRDS